MYNKEAKMLPVDDFLSSKCSKMRLWLGLRPGPAGGAYS